MPYRCGTLKVPNKEKTPIGVESNPFRTVEVNITTTEFVALNRLRTEIDLDLGEAD